VIHHLSLPASETRHVAEVLVELLDGTLTRFGPNEDSWIAWAGDVHGTAVEIYPSGTELFPAEDDGQARFRRSPSASRFTSTHATLSVTRSVEEVLRLADREGWRAVRMSRGPHEVIEFWLENAVMLEIMTPEMTRDYLASVPRQEH
jgi:hypothetical protein